MLGSWQEMLRLFCLAMTGDALQKFLCYSRFVLWGFYELIWGFVGIRLQTPIINNLEDLSFVFLVCFYEGQENTNATQYLFLYKLSAR